MQQKRKSHFLAIIIALIYTLFCVAPWLLLAKFILKVNLDTLIHSPLAIMTFLLMWTAISVGNIIRDKPQYDRDRISYKIALGYGKLLIIIIGIQFSIVICMAILMLLRK